MHSPDCFFSFLKHLITHLVKLWDKCIIDSSKGSCDLMFTAISCVPKAKRSKIYNIKQWTYGNPEKWKGLVSFFIALFPFTWLLNSNSVFWNFHFILLCSISQNTLVSNYWPFNMHFVVVWSKLYKCVAVMNFFYILETTSSHVCWPQLYSFLSFAFFL